MGQYECNFCEIGKKNRSLMYKLVKDLSRADMQYLLRWRLLEDWIIKRKMKQTEFKKKFVQG